MQEVKERQFPEHFYQSVKLAELTENDFNIPISDKHGHSKCRIINVQNGSTFTTETHDFIDGKNGELCWEESPYGLIATFERYGKNGNRAHGLITGDVLKRGAVATTYSHDNHNLLVIGHNKQDMLLAANEVIKKKAESVA